MICPECKGTFRDKDGLLYCDFCHGKKELDWIESIIGVERNSSRLKQILVCVLFDKNNKIIDWFDPILKVEESDRKIKIFHETGTIYEVPRSRYSWYQIREKNI
jgi:hypothetical protein